MRRGAVFTVIWTSACAVTVGGAFLTFAACGSGRLPAPTFVAHPAEAGALVEVEYPPPPARVEFVPPQPDRDDAVWIDGEWTWQGGRWGWKPGRWVAPPANAAFAPWTSVRDKLGILYVAEGKWRDAQGRELPDPAPLAVARTRGGAVVDPEGETVPSTPNVPSTTPRGDRPSKALARDAGTPETPSGATPTGTEPKSGPRSDDGSAPRDGGASSKSSKESAPPHEAPGDGSEP